jgi:adenylylsulfate kinase-like enzyme
VSPDRIPLLWLCGPPGVGKSTVGWSIYDDLSRQGVPVAYVDIDQLGMCYPASPSDPSRHRVKAENLAHTADTFRAAGARSMIVSGVVDSRCARDYAAQVGAADVTLCQLRIGDDLLRRRLEQRGWSSELIAAALHEGRRLDRGDVADFIVDTTGLTVDEVVRRVRGSTGGGPMSSRAAIPPGLDREPPVRSPTRPTGSALWICGPRGVGKSTVGWLVFMTLLRGGTSTAFVDLAQVGFLRPEPFDDPGNHRVKARNLAAVWRTFSAAAAERLVVVGPVNRMEDVRRYRRQLSETPLTVIRLTAGRERLEERILLRQQPGGPRLVGDPLLGQPTDVLLSVADAAADEADRLERARLGDLTVDTDGRTAADVAAMVQAVAGG